MVELAIATMTPLRLSGACATATRLTRTFALSLALATPSWPSLAESTGIPHIVADASLARLLSEDVTSAAFEIDTVGTVCAEDTAWITGGTVLTLREGTFDYPDSEPKGPFWFTIDAGFGGVQREDINGDGAIDAVVPYYCGRNSPVIGLFIVDGADHAVWTLGLGSGAFGGLESVSVEPGFIKFSQADGNYRCCPERIITRFLTLQGDMLIPVRPPEVRSFE